MTLFGTAGIRGSVEETVTPALALAVGQAAGEPGRTFVLGRDGRDTGSSLTAAMAAGLESAGAAVRLVGQVPTPTLAYASRGRHGVMITASHNPPADNGIKLFDDGVEYDREAERAIETAIRFESGVPHTPNRIGWERWSQAERLDVLEDYRDAVAGYVRDRFAASDEGQSTPKTTEPTHGDDILAGLSVVVDCGTGVGALATPQVLERLGADVVAMNATVDGHFPARESKPTAETLSDLARFLEDGAFDLGLAHDGDADRLVVLDSSGEVVHEDTVLAVVGAHYTRTATCSDPVVVTTPNASARIDEAVRTAGGRVERVRLGALHEGIARVREREIGGRSGTDETTVVFAAEPWKHIHTEFGGWIDGVTSAAVVAALVTEAGTVDALRKPISERPYRKVSVDCPDEAKGDAMTALETHLPDTFPNATVETDYGLRLEFPDASWILVRPSGTENYVRIYAESDDVEGLVSESRDVVERVVASLT